MEAALEGVPSVVSDVGGLPEAVADGETGFLCRAKDGAYLAELLLNKGYDVHGHVEHSVYLLGQQVLIPGQAATGGFIQTGDTIRIDVPNRRLDVDLSEEELATRRASWTPPKPRFERGFGWMFTKHIEQADKGCDFDFLKTEFGGPVPEPEIN